MIAKYLWELGAFIFLFLGSMHLWYTLFSDKFSSRNDKVVSEMKSSYPKLTKETTIWKAWIGFNASHSAGAIFFGIYNIYLAYAYFEILQKDLFFLIFNLLTILFYLWLAKKYWFRIPFLGILISLFCFLGSFLITNFT